MKKTIVLSVILCLAAFCQSADAQTSQKHLTDAQILGSLPAGILEPASRPVRFWDNNTLLYIKGRDLCQYDVRKKVSSKSDLSLKDVLPSFDGRSNLPELVKGWKNPTYSPDGSRIAYTLDNDLYSMDVKTNQITRHTFDGSDVILNGYASWVYYEEILGRPSMYRAFWWSPDSKVLAFYRFDNSKVPVFPIYHPSGLHGTLDSTRYPKAGDINPEVRIGFVSANGGETVWAEFNPEIDQYFGIPFWSGDGKRFMVAWMDRAQDNLELFSVNPYDGQKVSVYKEHQDSYIDWMEQMLFSEKGIYIVRDFSGWQQIYFLSYDGTKFEQLTQGRNWSVSLLRVDRNWLYYTAKCESTVRTGIYRVKLGSKKIERLSSGDLSYSGVVISEDGRNIAALASNCKTPTKLVNISIGLGKAEQTVVADSKGAAFDEYALALPEIVYIRNRDGQSIPARVIWPVGMDRTKKYPVKVDLYGGPDNPQVRDSWAGLGFATQWWANHGVIQIVLDNRDGGHLGKEGMNQAYRKLGTVEFEDFVDGIKYFRGLPYVNEEKVGVEGFSFGGTMTTLCVTEANKYFQYGIAGGGVYDWALYDSHYTERYMDRPQDNPEGYAAGRVIDRIDNYRGDDSNMLRLTHGTGDDNVHFQNTLQLVAKLQEKHKDFELMIYPDGMHGYRGDQQKHCQYQNYKFWYKYLLGRDMPESLKNYFCN